MRPAILAATFALATSASAADRLVPQQYATIQAAVDAAADGDVIRIASPGLSERGISIAGRRLAIEGANGQAVTVDAQQLGRHLTITGSAVVTLRNLRLVNGREPASFGGAVRFEGSSLSIEGCSFDSNSAIEGGAVWVGSGTVRIGRCWFSSNAAVGGSSRFGGALRHAGGEVTVWSTRFTGNSSTYQGGAISHGWGDGSGSNAGALRLVSCLFDSNSAVYGGALHTYRSGTAVTLTNVTMVGNGATFGSAIVSYYGDVRLSNSIVSGSGELFRLIHGGSFRGASCITSSGSLQGPGNRTMNPGLSVDFVPLPGSPCIDAGSPSLLVSAWTATGAGSACQAHGVDLLGNARVMDVIGVANQGCGGSVSAVDIGAVEVAGVPAMNPILMDLDGDSRVTGLDLGMVLGAWGQPSCTMDLNLDGIVNSPDIGLLLGRWGTCSN
jgi:hypothetical protein